MRLPFVATTKACRARSTNPHSRLPASSKIALSVTTTADTGITIIMIDLVGEVRYSVAV
jgi:hypothetical protein